jgi:hypothetical protein
MASLLYLCARSVIRLPFSRAERYITAYIDQLQALELYVLAAKVRKACEVPSQDAISQVWLSSSPSFLARPVSLAHERRELIFVLCVPYGTDRRIRRPTSLVRYISRMSSCMMGNNHGVQKRKRTRSFALSGSSGSDIVP